MRLEKECPGCKKHRPMTKHHVKPVRHFGRKNNKTVFLLCRPCHDELERMIPYELMPLEFYEAIIHTFLYIKARNRKLVEHIQKEE